MLSLAWREELFYRLAHLLVAIGLGSQRRKVIVLDTEQDQGTTQTNSDQLSKPESVSPSKRESEQRLMDF